ncbi:MAG: class I SAM-dependent methyltransferase [Candidatus Jettenia sp.]|uniref:Class I SAM-dependent methyltransferase n=2 Tax=Candidatus Jettenia TaxID=360731 RepID=I3IQT3_9BACT|nr:MAG: class I SAM-dependent methyltransferase [Candidatus Jettenia sp. AMX1]MBC6928203.1 class I SAM-dependent methyltransferase [Candidatus Jettenia sp.]GAB64078.1 conserved hypothetical protein [Candidatus Jettenia caeni]MCE7879592.1 class I SAM-dependent methyltransferase [Candidatus Jettenia sp. AMX1]MCQ3926951.1 class I SAM-dependent methyltransferase [Candidatus Jettenia sp.]
MCYIVKIIIKIFDIISCLITPFIAFVSSVQTRVGPERFPLTYMIWDIFHVSPIRHHYYQPVFNVRNLPERIWNRENQLPGIDFNIEGQLSLLRSFNYNSELEVIPIEKPKEPLGFFHNNSFGVGDAEILYNMVRHFKTKKVIEIGSGFSTRMMKKALDKNREEGFLSSHICIEPYEMHWLESLGIDKVIRSKVEDVDPILFNELRENDILFIDSSHVLRIGGDVFVEYLQIIPNLRKGVLVHIHDIFLPNEYPRFWIMNKRRFWTEQYLLQAFLAFNSKFEVLLAVNYLASYYSEEFSLKCPVYAKKLKRGTGSFWIRKID